MQVHIQNEIGGNGQRWLPVFAVLFCNGNILFLAWKIGFDTVTNAGNKETDTNAESAADTTENTSTENGKTLVVYYSASGNTKDVAEKIAKITDGDLFEIEPKEPYTDDDLDWTNDDSRVSKEHDDESLRDVELVSTTVDNWETYNTVYIGYPIWWGEAPHIVYTLVENINLRGKTVVPFCTSLSSGVGESASHLKKNARISSKRDWKSGQNFYDGSTQETINTCIKTTEVQLCTLCRK